jgi:hypothetical protein
MGQTSWFRELDHPMKDMLQEFLQTWEELKDGRIQGQLNG